MQEELSEILESVCQFMNEEDIEYVLVGGVAVMVYGRPRSTMDIDVIIQMEEDKVGKFVDFLKNEGFQTSREDLEAAFDEKSHATAFFEDSIFRLDLKGVYNFFDRKTLERREKIDFEGVGLSIASPEDTLVNKIRFGSEKDLKDAESIWRRQESLDRDYMEEMSRRLGISQEYRDFVEKISS